VTWAPDARAVILAPVRTGRLYQLGPEHRDIAFAFAAHRPALCTFIAGWIQEGGLVESPRVPRGWLLAEFDPDGAVEGLAYISDTGIVMPALGSPEGLADVAAIGRRHPNAVRVLVGAREQVAGIWAHMARRGAMARQIRDQAGYLVHRDHFTDLGPLDLEIATPDHLDQLVQASADMAREEAQDDPQGRNPGLFRERIRERMLRGRDLIHLEGGRLLFKSNVAAISRASGQVEGIYTLPHARRRGLGTRGTSAVTRWVLSQAEQAFLLVNEDNTPARRLYERLGYREVMKSRTIFVAP
jgi:ribosomal protein S18 acetylase RimI-like enzyme